MARLSATEVAREFSSVVNRVNAGEEIEVVRNGVPVVEMRPARRGHFLSIERWDEVLDSLPFPDEDYAEDVEAARKSIGPPSGAWPS